MSYSGGSNNGSTVNGPSNQINSVALANAQGVTAQGALNPVYLAASNSALGNTYDQVAPGTAAPGYATPGNPAVAQPGGANVLLVPGGQYNTDNQVQLVAANAGTPGGGGYYPSGFQSPATAAVPNPMLANGWTSQGNADNDAPKQLTVTVNAQYTGTHGVAASPLFTPTISGGTSPYTVTTTNVDGLDTSTLPTGFTMTASTGALALTTGTSLGTHTLSFLAKDSSSPALEAEYNVEVVLS